MESTDRPTSRSGRGGSRRTRRRRSSLRRGSRPSRPRPRNSAADAPRPECEAELVARLRLPVQRLLAEQEIAAPATVEGAAEDVDRAGVLGLLPVEVDDVLPGHRDGEV